MDCSIIMCREAMWSVQDLSWRNPACSGLNLLSRASFSLSKMTLVSTLLGADRSMIPRQLPQCDRSPFFGSLTKWPRLQSAGTSSCSQILRRRGCSISADVVGSALSASGGIPSGPPALPFFIFLMALMISAFVSGFVFTLRCSVAGGMLGTVSGGGWFKTSLKCSTHRLLCLASLVMVLPFLFLTSLLGWRFFPP